MRSFGRTGFLLPVVRLATPATIPKGHRNRERGKRKKGREKIEQGSRTAFLRRHRASYVSSGSFTLSAASLYAHAIHSVGCGVLRASFDDDYHYEDDYDSLTPVAIGVCCSFVSDQFTSLHKKETVDPCGVAGIFGCNAGATTHAARSGPGYVNINGYKVSLVDVDIKLLG